MDIRSQISMVFHLDKCIGCHTCSIACKNVWTDRKGAEYMWWNNVETKPGTGFPTRWEDQEAYRGGWEVEDGKLRLKSSGKGNFLKRIFYQPNMPTLEEYYEPWTYDYENLFNAPEGDDQPVARPVSKITGEYMEVESGPNWDDDLSGSPLYARNDPNLKALTEEQQLQLLSIEQLVMFYLPRICNHCLNPACVASCPSGALYKRGEDGIVLVNQEVCRGWRFCVSACPYKKVFYNWNTGKSEKCLLCYPRVETGQAPACFHSCVGRIRYMGVILYDADKIADVGLRPDSELVEAHREMLLDPHDPAVIEAAHRAGISDAVVKSAQQSPVYKFVKEWGLALAPHPEYRTFPMLFYVPALAPVTATQEDGLLSNDVENLFGAIDDARTPMAYLASLFSAGQEGPVRYAMKKQMAVRLWRRALTVGDIEVDVAKRALREANCSPEEAEEIYKMTSLPTFEDRFVIPPSHREQAIEVLKNPLENKGLAGIGFRETPERGF
jgi:nitrate reductase beta subunit